MTLDQVREVVREYQQRCTEWGCPPETALKASDTFDAYKDITDGPLKTAGDVALRHLSYMCVEILKMCDEGRTEKVMRWLGFVQAVLWCTGLKTLRDLKAENSSLSESTRAVESALS